MDKNPKRRKYGDNPYSLSKNESENLYIVSFKDISGIIQTIKVTKEVWEIFDEYERLDISIMNEFDRHTEHSEVYENNLEKRAKEKVFSMEDDFIQKATFEELKNSINKLEEPYKRRIKMYYFDDKNETEIAEFEHISQQAVSKSLHIAIENLRELLKNFQN